MDELGYGLAWRVLDAQFFGVAQRRRRVFLVGHLGDQRAAEVLFEPESLRWDTPSSREKREALTRGTQNGVDVTGMSINWNRTDARCTFPVDTSLVQTLSAHMGTGGDNVPPVYCASDSGTNSAIGLDIAPTLTVHDSRSASYVSITKTLQVRSRKAGGGKVAFVHGDMGATLTCGMQQTMFPGNGSVRRLTPVECERLQGFPDDWTDIPYRGKPHAPDSVRYKALGNSMAVPVMRWIGRRIKEASS